MKKISLSIPAQDLHYFSQENLGCVFLLLVMCVVFFGQALIEQSRTQIWDNADQAYPMFAYIAHYLKKGILPLWNPYLYSGYPIFADPIFRVFSPVAAVFYLLSDFSPFQFYLIEVINFFLTGVFMFYLCRHLRYDPVPALIAAVAYMLMGFLNGHFQHFQINEIALWLPLLFLILDRALSAHNLKTSLAGSVVLAMAILGNQPQPYYYLCFALGVHWLCRTITFFKTDQRRFFFCLRAGLIFFVGAILLSAVQLLPTYELSQFSLRSGLQDLQSSGHGLMFKNLITLFIPNFYGGITTPYWLNQVDPHYIDISQQNLYMGFIPAFISAWGLFFKRSKRYFYWLIMAVLALLISLGNTTPFYALLYYVIPGFATFRDCMHYGFIFHFFVSLLAAEGMTSLLNDRGAFKKLIPYTLFFLVAIGLYSHGLPDVPQGKIALPLYHRALGDFSVVAGLSVLFLALLTFFSGKKQQALGLFIVVFLFCEIFYLTADSWTIGKGYPKNGTASAHQQLEQDVGIVKPLLNHVGMDAEALLYESSNPDIRWAYQDKDLFRIHVSKDDEIADFMQYGFVGFNRPIMHGVFILHAFIPMRQRRFTDFLHYFKNNNPQRLFELLNVRYQLHVDTAQKKYSIIEHKTALDRFSFVGHAVFAAHDADILKILAQRDFDPHHALVLEKPIEGFRDATSDRTPEIKITSYLPNTVELTTRSDKNGFLLWSELYYPGWRAFIDGVETEILRANYLLKAITLPEGGHNIKFIFSPFSLKLGATISGTTALIIACLFLLSAKKNRHPS